MQFRCAGFISDRVMQMVCVSIFTLFLCTPAHAHFGMVIPSDNVATQDSRKVDLALSFSHPFELAGMVLEKPNAFWVQHGKKKTDLLASLGVSKVMGKKGWKASFTPKRPGVYQFLMEPKPYWEPAEDCFIIHYTKTYLAAFGAEEGWDVPLGVKTEIVPLTRPFGNYAGNVFTGQVLLDGKPVAGAEVEIEYYNSKNALKAPTEYHVTRVVKADENGVFTASCPLAGWWGFAALNTADYTLKDPSGKMKSVELGAVLWIKTDNWGKR